MQTLQSTILGAAVDGNRCERNAPVPAGPCVGRKLLCRDGLPLARLRTAAIFLSLVNGCRLDGRTDGILLVVGSDLAADKM